jgi:hypothetical protein
VGIGPRVEDDPDQRSGADGGTGLLQPIDEDAFVIGLAHLDGPPELGRHPLALLTDVSEGLGAVDLRLARAQQVEVGSVEDEHRRHGPMVCRAAGRCYSRRPSNSLRTSGVARSRSVA